MNTNPSPLDEPHMYADFKNTAEAFDQVRADYDAARQSRFRRRRRGLAPQGAGADYHLRSEQQWAYMIEWARDVWRNHPLVRQGVRRLANLVLGKGPTLNPQTGSDALDQLLRKKWRAWSESREACDISERYTFGQLRKLSLKATVGDGDVSVLLLSTGQLEVMEAHRLRTPRRSIKNIVLGIEQDVHRRHLRYYFTHEDLEPYRQVSLVRETTPVEARDADSQRQVLHLHLPERVSETRGISCLAPVNAECDMGGDLHFSMLVKAQVSNALTFIHELALESGFKNTAATGAQTTETQRDGSTRELEGVAPGMRIKGVPGEKITGFVPQVPNPEFIPFDLLILSFIAVNLDLPLIAFLLDATQTNFTGWRGAIDLARERFRELQEWEISELETPVYKWKVRGWLEEDAELAALAMAEGVDVFAHEFAPRGWDYIEPAKDTTADLLQVSNALNSPRRIQAARGRDWETVAEEIVNDHTYAVTRAKQAAQEINDQFPDDAHPVAWRDLLGLPLAQGVTVSLATEQTQGAGDSGQRTGEEGDGSGPANRLMASNGAAHR